MGLWLGGNTPSLLFIGLLMAEFPFAKAPCLVHAIGMFLEETDMGG